jgi:hypothetical protein
MQDRKMAERCMCESLRITLACYLTYTGFERSIANSEGLDDKLVQPLFFTFNIGSNLSVILMEFVGHPQT